MAIVIGKICRKPRLYGPYMQKIKKKIYDRSLISENLKKASDTKVKLDAEKVVRDEQLRNNIAAKLYIESGFPNIGK